ncbi:DUF4345 domain-containing protein [Flavobacterium sp.]|jgi:hypothetical protein|uniref:DUF4345 domain-containing protein n=1 Tax=Flavobacterium sp. TaxID=239 RepID=UPI0037BE4C70
MIRKNIHLIISVMVVIPAALFYGLNPNITLSILFDFDVHSTDLKSVFRAIMGLYLAFSGFWILGIFNSNFWKASTLSNGVFMSGIAIGRIVGLMLDGKASDMFFFGFFGEAVLGLFAFYQYNKYRHSI